MFGIGLAAGVIAGLAAGAALVRYGLGLGERMAYGNKDGSPALGHYAPPLMQANTDGTEDMDDEDLE